MTRREIELFTYRVTAFFITKLHPGLYALTLPLAKRVFNSAVSTVRVCQIYARNAYWPQGSIYSTLLQS